MSELPSRKPFTRLQDEPMVDGHLPPGWRTVLREFGSGRLVDQETEINYEAGCQAQSDASHGWHTCGDAADLAAFTIGVAAALEGYRRNEGD